MGPHTPLLRDSRRVARMSALSEGISDPTIAAGAAGFAVHLLRGVMTDPGKPDQSECHSDWSVAAPTWPRSEGPRSTPAALPDYYKGSKGARKGTLGSIIN